MTDSSDPKAPKSSRKKSAREPATLDLKATVVDDGAQQDEAWQNMRPEETVMPETASAAEDTVASPEATLDSGAGTDSIGPGPSPEEPPAPEEPPEAAAPVDAAPRRRTSPAALIGSGLLGGLVGAGIVYGLQVWQDPAPQDDQRLAQLEQRVSALGQSPAVSPGDMSALEERLGTLETARGSLDQRLQEIRTLAERASTRAEEALNQPPPPAPAPQNEEQINQLTERLAALESQFQASAQSAASATDATQALQRRLGEQEQRLSDLSRQVSEENQGAETAAQAGIRVVLAERLDDALRSGVPYPGVLQALRQTGTQAERVAALEPFAEQGAPTAEALLESFEPLEAAILRDERASSGAWGDRLLRMMDRVVTVRPVDQPGSTGVSSAVARIRQALRSGDLKAAAEAWAALPEPARRLSEDWGRQVTAAAQARQASREIADAALAALNRSTQ